jgi:hypothetical protein
MEFEGIWGNILQLEGLMHVYIVNMKFSQVFYCRDCALTLSALGHMAAIVRRPLSGNFTRSETHAVKNSEVLSFFFHLHSINN